MIKIMSTERYKSLLSDNKLLKLRVYGIVGSYDDMTYAELSKIRRERVSELKQVDAKMKEFAAAIAPKAKENKWIKAIRAEEEAKKQLAAIVKTENDNYDKTNETKDMNIDNAQKFLINSGRSELAKMLLYDTETKTCTELMATLLEEYHQSEVLKLNTHNVIVTKDALCISGDKETATHGIGNRKTLCSKCWNKIAG
ncbi:MAG: hypothetical protein COA36_16670 [Desulfotalea sp.]|nr:MAG: hypothetical protein COA36_16670 [Desulfotalea sp.]